MPAQIEKMKPQNQQSRVGFAQKEIQLPKKEKDTLFSQVPTPKKASKVVPKQQGINHAPKKEAVRFG